MRLPLLTALLLMSPSCTPGEGPSPQSAFGAVRWVDVDALLPQPAGARSLGRTQLDEVLGEGLCLEGDDARARLEQALKARGWQVTSAEAIDGRRLDLTATRGPLLLTGSLTDAPAAGCERGFVYAVRKAVAP